MSETNEMTVEVVHGDGAVADPGGETLLDWSANGRFCWGVRGARRLEERQTPYQRLEVFEAPLVGRLLCLDGHFMVSEQEEFFYHEAMIHPAAIAHPDPRQALIIGGGDGGAAEELLKHPGIERAVLAELDAEVVEVARRYFARVHRDVFDDPRLELRIGDGFAFVRETADAFDLIAMDLTDPETPAKSLYTAEFFAMCRRVLNPGGALTLHLGSPFAAPDQVRDIGAALRESFQVVRHFGLYIPVYGTSMAMAIASDSLDPLSLTRDRVARRLEERGIRDLGYYNAEVHGALFALPNYHRALLE